MDSVSFGEAPETLRPTCAPRPVDLFFAGLVGTEAG